MNLHEFLIVCPLVFLAGFVDAIAGGGGLISLPAYMFAGIPVHHAIATNKLSSATGTAVSTWHLVKSKCVDICLVPGPVACCCILCIAGQGSETGDTGRIYQKKTVSDHGSMFFCDRYL